MNYISKYRNVCQMEPEKHILLIYNNLQNEKY